jgi:uncharacterized repeat protein (TIGR01451 family)
MDLVIGGNNAQVGWYANEGAGSYGAQQAIDGFVNPGRGVCGDVDGDGDADVLVFGLPVGTVWFANDGLGQFAVGDTLPVSEQGLVADFDGDGDVDMTLATGTSCDVRILRNAGGASWAALNVEQVSGYSLQNSRYAVGDLNGDGLPELITCSGMDIGGWYPNQGDGTMGLRKRFCDHMSGAVDVSAADIDLDGDLDLATASYYGDFVAWYPNNGDGTFGRQQVVVENKNLVSASRLVDLNADGLPDIVTNNATCAIIWNVSGGAGWSPATLPGQGVSRCEADLDGDLDLDLIGVGAWYENDGSGNFTQHDDALLGTGTARAADMNGDGLMDVVLSVGAGFTTLINDGAGGFTALPGNGAGASLYALGDIDGDGDVDAVSLVSGTALRGHFNDGSGTLTGPVTLHTGQAGTARTVLLHDLNGDGVLDAAWALSNGYTHRTFYNLGIGDGTLGPANIIDPSAESAAALLLADLNNDAVEDLVTARFRTIGWQENQFFNAFRVRGSVFQDFDYDAVLDAGEPKVPFQLVRSDVSSHLVWTNSAGDYDLPAAEGTWSVWTQPAGQFEVTNDPPTLTANLTVAEPIATGYDFGLVPNISSNASMLSLVGIDWIRCNENVTFFARLQNTGTLIPEDILLDLYIHPDMTVNLMVPPPDSVVADHYYWHVDSLGWFQSWQATFSTTIGPFGSFSSMELTATWNEPEPGSIQLSAGGEVGCAYDPNDKQVDPKGYGATGSVAMDTEWLSYTIRFQNTGNDTAFTVELRDQLDPQLDWASMQVLGASHELTSIVVDEDGLARFRFFRILLPDSIVNEPLSHGYLRYRIRPLPGVEHGTEITNTAAIYFDLNEPVITNTVLNTFIDCGTYTATITALDVDVLQATAGDHYQWFLDGAAIPEANDQVLLTLGAGTYTVEVVNAHGCVLLSAPYQVINTGVGASRISGVRVLPNPATGDARLESAWPLGTDDRIEVLDAQGRVLLTRRGTGSTSVVIGRGGLAAGVYELRVQRGAATLAWARIVFE